MANPQFFSTYTYPITLKPLTAADLKFTYQDIFNLQNSFRILIKQIDTRFADTVEEAPEDGETYGRKDKTWVVLETGEDSNLTIQSTVATQGQSDLVIGTVGIILSCYSDVPARIRLYCTAAGRTLDESRLVGTKADREAGLIFEFVATAAHLGAQLNPVPTAHNGDSPTKNEFVYANIQPTSDPTCSVTFEYIKLL